MKTIRDSFSQILLLILSLLGAGIAIYLTAVHYENAPLLCSSSGIIDCARVLASQYSVIPGTTIPITVPGLAWCTISVALAITGLRLQPARHQVRWLRIAQFALSLSGMLVVLYLVYAEIVRLHTICAWCTALHVIILVMFLITLVQLQNPQTDMEPEAEKPTVTTGSR